MTDQFEKDIFLRLSPGGEIGNALREIMTRGSVTRQELLEELGMTKRGIMALGYFSRQTDNLLVAENGDGFSVKYTDVVKNYKPNITVQNAEIGTGKIAGLGTGDNVDPEDMDVEFVWAEAPKIMDKHEFKEYRVPSWQKRAEFMCIDMEKHVALEGPPSVGKDTTVNYLSAKHEVPLVPAPGDGGIRRKDLVGSPEMVNGTTYFMVAPFATAVVMGYWAVLPEVNAADPDVLMLLNSVMAEPYTINIHGRNFPVHENFRVWLTFNANLIGTKPFPQSTRDRLFSIKVPWFTEHELKERLIAHGMPRPDDSAPVEFTQDNYGNHVELKHWQDQIVTTGLALWEMHTNGHLAYQITFRRLQDAATLVENGISQNVRQALKWSILGAIDSWDDTRKAEKCIEQNTPGDQKHVPQVEDDSNVVYWTEEK